MEMLVVALSLACCGLAVAASFGIVVWMLVSSVRRKGKMGINVRREDCPECGEPAPRVRAPANFRQFMWGGWTCSSCGTELDKWGQEV